MWISQPSEGRMHHWVFIVLNAVCVDRKHLSTPLLDWSVFVLSINSSPPLQLSRSNNGNSFFFFFFVTERWFNRFTKLLMLLASGSHRIPRVRAWEKKCCSWGRSRGGGLRVRVSELKLTPSIPAGTTCHTSLGDTTERWSGGWVREKKKRREEGVSAGVGEKGEGVTMNFSWTWTWPSEDLLPTESRPKVCHR